MHVLTADDPAEEAILRTPSHLNTVTSPEQDGAGIAGPQVGVAPKYPPSGLQRVAASRRFGVGPV